MKNINLDSSKLMGYRIATTLNAKVGTKSPVNDQTGITSGKLGGKVGMVKPV